ncbi:hypothetical protein ABZ054_24035, partial [Streptomyces sp. NPDC006324]
MATSPANQDIGHEQRLWRRVHPPAGREGLVPVAFVFADTIEAKAANTVAVPEEVGRRPGRRAGTTPSTRRLSPRGTAARRCPSSSPFWSSRRSTTPMWRRPGRTGEQTPTAALGDSVGHAL